ncbi:MULTISPECIES: hypothetical protein [Sphingobacterium]|uniref:TapB family protein n=1 Tax=Sphingobacterium TaxID=28453 RepID=UPI00257A9ADA|nr:MULTISPECIES: hypothetical protein [Sphingobacterium]
MIEQTKNLVLLALIIAGHNAFAQTVESRLLKKGTRIDMVEFDANKVQNKTKVLTVESVSGKTSKVRSVTTEKGNVTENNLQTYHFENGEATWTNDAVDTKTKRPAIIIYPANMQAGQKINNDVTFEQTGTTPDGKKATVSVKITDRKVIGKEKVTVKGGTWDCTKLSYKFSLGLKVAFINIPFNVDAVEWYNPDVGVVKTEYSIKGAYAGHAEIASVQ